MNPLKFFRQVTSGRHHKAIKAKKIAINGPMERRVAIDIDHVQIHAVVDEVTYHFYGVERIVKTVMSGRHAILSKILISLPFFAIQIALSV